MAMDQADVENLFKEVYPTLVPEAFEKWDNFCSKIRTDQTVEQFGPRGLLRSIQMTLGGRFGMADPDGGDLGRGNGPTFKRATITPLMVRVAMEYTRASEWYTANKTISVQDATAKLMAAYMSQFMTQMDKHLFTSGNGVLGEIESGSAGTSLVMALPFGARRMYNDNVYTVYPADLSAPRGDFVAETVDYLNRTVTIDAIVAGTIDTDLILAENVTGADPVGFKGLYYQNDSASTGLWDGIDRADFPQIRTPEVVAGGQLIPQHIRLLKSLMQSFRGEDVFKKGRWQPVCHFAQKAALEENMTNVVTYTKGGAGDTFDMNFNMEESTLMGMKALTSPTANNTRIDFVDYDNWGRGESLPVGMYSVGDKRLFPIYGTSGGLATAVIGYLVHICQYFTYDPGRAGYISSLTVPDGFDSM